MPHLRIWMVLLLFGGVTGSAASARIDKVLPHYLDKQGRHTLAPSLFERDAYQAHLRQHPQERSAVRFDLHWRASGLAKNNLKLRVEARGSGGDSTKPLVLETTVRAPGFLGKWSALTVEGEDYQKFGELIAWHATLWNGETLVAEQKSFLW